MALIDTIWVNGRSLEDMKMYPSSVKGILSGMSMEWQEAYVPGHVGMAVTSAEGKIKPRDIILEGRIEVATYDLLFPAIQEFLAWMMSTPLEIYTERDKTKVYYGRVEEQPIVAYEPELISVDASVSVKIRCQDPLVYDRTSTIIGFASTPEDIAVGTGWTSGIIKLFNCVDPTVTLRAPNGTIVQALKLNSVSLLTSEYVLINSLTRTISKVSGGVVTSLVANMDSVTNNFPLVLSPADGSPDNPPTITVTGGTAPTGLFLYRKTYL